MKMLVGIDFSGSADQVVGKAAELATALAAKVWLLHVAAPDPAFAGFEAGPQTVRDSVSDAFHAEHSRIQQMADRLRKDGLDATALLVQGATVETILKEATKLEADMIVVGSHGHFTLQHLLGGSVSKGVLHRSECPILVVPTHS